MLTFTRRTASRAMSCSRQALPRPARLYSSPTKRVDAPALATAAPNLQDYPAYMPTTKHSRTSEQSMNEMRSFLSQDQRYTILPTPLPENEYSALDDMYFPETSMQDQVSIIDACLHNNYDVPRAKEIFERIRSDPRMTSHMTTRLYDAMLTGYNEMALRDPDMSDMWIEDALALYETMEDGGAQIAPSANTYANMLLLWLRVENQMMGPLSAMTTLVKPVTLLRRIVDREIPVSLVISNKAFTLSEDAAQAIKVLSRAAVDANLPNLSKVIMELGTVETLGTQLEDGSEALPEVMPVMKTKLEVKHAADGSVADVEISGASELPQTEIPFNLAILRKHLADVILARRVLTGDNLSRQKLLEASVYDVAVERLKHQAQKLEDLGLGNKGLEHADLKGWMWNWHQKLQVRLKAEVADLVAQEEHGT